ncbi:unnamed protein product [Microthlaspi erraticum]|uniref:BTB domain-containing protein n=1 Tax=Microthlaspi erraticum TaxID=1685480 RepID=A0A6D2HNQ3_9BRAS|nr:unnamed protein product [Microthlaspi erraticum]CAA7040238.1 unnamed protein product [Microthlaspi erraticum]
MGLDSDLSLSGSGSDHVNFGFAFNDVNFSDRLLRIEIAHGGEVSRASDVGCVRDRKRRREEDEDVNNNETHKGGEDETTNPSVKELHISSPILAAKSPFFYKLFSNGMLESEQKHVTLKIDASEEAAVMELLKFMYSNSLTLTNVPALLSVLMAADKFEVASCMKHCCSLLRTMPMTLDSALLLLHLPPTLIMADSVKPLVNSARRFIASRYKDISNSPVEEVMALPLIGIKILLANDDLQVSSEDVVYELVSRWLRLHYSGVRERQDVLASHLARFIRFPHMSCQRLKRMLLSDDFRPSIAKSIVLDALFFKTDSSDDRPAASSLNRRLVERAYNFKPIKTVEFEAPRQHCIVYMDFKRRECESLYPSRWTMSQAFQLGGRMFYLSAHCTMDQLSLSPCFGLFLWLHGNGSVSQALNYQFSARSKPTEEFRVRVRKNFTLVGGQAVGFRDLFGMPWDRFMAEDCPHFINGVLHLRAELSIGHL